MTIADKTVLVTGANRGIGRALVAEALRRGAKRVYAGTRQPLAHPDGRVMPLTLDVTNQTQIQAAAESVDALDVLVNNARHLAVRRPERPCHARGAPGRQLLRHLGRNRGLPAPADSFQGSDRQQRVADGPRRLAAHAGLLDVQAAAFSLTQSLRALLAARGVRAHAVLTGPTDTDMTRGFDIPKASPESVARAIFDGVEAGEEDIFPDPMSQTMAEGWRSGAAMAFERQNAALTQAQPVTA